MARSRLAVREMTLFRVLTEEESRSVKRWQAPSLSSAEATLKVASQPSSRQSTMPENANETDAEDDSHDAIRSDVEPDSSVKADEENTESVSLEETPMNVAAAANISAEMLQSSYDEGFSAGFAEGNAAAYETDNQGLSKILKSLSEQEVLRDETILEDIIELVKVTTGLVLNQEIKTDASLIKDWVIEGLARLPATTAASMVRMHPLDADRVKQLVDPDLAIRIVEDKKLNRGDCHIEVGASSVRTGVYEQICRLTANQTSDDRADAQGS